MIIGVPKEIKNHEYRVGLIPGSVRELVHHGHTVLIETGAGVGSGVSDVDYINAGAIILASAPEVFERAELIVKVKEPQAHECQMLKAGQVLFAYLHLAPDPQQAELLLASGCTAIAYETVTDDQGGLPLLAPMSAVAGRMSIQAGAHCLEKSQGGRGILLGGVPGVLPANVVVIGSGVVGINAVRMAMGLGANVTLLGHSVKRLQELDLQFGSKLKTVYSTTETIEENVVTADLVIGAVLVPGAAAPKLVSANLIRRMRAGAVVIDVAIDQGGCFETSHPTTHDEPTYIVDDVVHYCVVNMPGAVARTSSFALNNVTLPYILELADKGYKQALLQNTHLQQGLNVDNGYLTHPAVAAALHKPYVLASSILTE